MTAKSTYPRHVLKDGSHGKAVLRIQSRLNAERAANPKDDKHQPFLDVDGKYGTLTETRVRQFQRHHKGPHGNPLVDDGKVGRFTWAALFDEPVWKPAKSTSKIEPGTLWLPYAERDPYSSVGAFVPAPARGVLHTTQGSGLPHYAGSAPQLTHNLLTGHVYQHMPLNESGLSLEHNGGIETNRMHAIQIENIGFAPTDPDQWPDEYYAHLATLMRDLEAACGIHRSCSVTFTTSSNPMSDTRWREYDGWCGHQHVPHQDRQHHWDPGRINIKALL